jgi:hypothetical protein
MFTSGVSRNITESDIYRVLGDFINMIFSGDVVQGQSNRAPLPPEGEHFIVIEGLGASVLSTNRYSYDVENGTQTQSRTAAWRYQIDCYGEEAASLADSLSTVFRSEWACDYFREHDDIMQPLYASNPRQLPFVNNSQQYEQRWSFDINVQPNAQTTLPQVFMTGVTIKLNPLL